MATKTVVISDLTGQQIDDADHVSIVVKEHPTLDGSVRLDAGSAEIKGLSDSASDYVVLEIHQGNGTLSLVVDVAKFDALFKGDVQAALESAERLSQPTRRGRPAGSRTSGAAAKIKRDPAQLAAIRAWSRQNGWPDLSDRGRIPAEAEAAYNSAK